MNDRLKKLYSNKSIDKETYEYLNEVVRRLDELGYDIKSYDVVAFILHLANSISRQKRGENIEGIDSAICREVIKDVCYGECILLWYKVNKQTPVKFSKTEEQFIILHLCRIIRNRLEH